MVETQKYHRRSLIFREHRHIKQYENGILQLKSEELAHIEIGEQLNSNKFKILRGTPQS